MSAPHTEPGTAPRVLGLTGGIASGKSTVSHLLAERGARIIDADRVGHQVIAPDGEAYPLVVAAFGTAILDEDGSIARAKLGAIVFADPARRQELNAISHPRMGDRMARQIREIRASPEPPALIVLDAAILFEAGWDALCDHVCTVEAPEGVSIARLRERDAMDDASARQRLAAQLDNAERARRAGTVLRNDGSLDELAARVEALWQAQVASG